MQRTKHQKEANEIDMELYRLMNRIYGLSDNSMFKDELLEAGSKVESARYGVRLLMHIDDRKVTGG
jgi:hypothetical protein